MHTPNPFSLFGLWSKCLDRRARAREWDYIAVPVYPDGAIIEVEFKCGKCGRKLLAEDVEIPPVGIGDKESETRRWGDTAHVECECGAYYEVVADNSISGWDVNFEGEKLPKTFRYKIYKIYGEEPEEDL